MSQNDTFALLISGLICSSSLSWICVCFLNEVKEWQSKPDFPVDRILFLAHGRVLQRAEHFVRSHV